MEEKKTDATLFDLEGANWITSKDLIKKTGISRATLNNYIKQGILPRPVVKKGGLGLKGTKQIGFFPIGVLDRLNMVRRLKREGLSMKEITSRCREIWPRKNAEVSETQFTPPKEAEAEHPDFENFTPFSTPSGSSEDIDLPTRQLDARTRPAMKADTLSLTIGNIGTPAYLINHSNEIEWINNEAQEIIFHRKIDATMSIGDRNLFRLLFSQTFQDHVLNWQEVLGRHLQLIYPKASGGDSDHLFQGITDQQRQIIAQLRGNMPHTENRSSNVRDLPVRLETTDGISHSYKVYLVIFREGLLVVYVPTDRASHEIMEILAQRERIINELRSQRMPSLVNLCVLVADLQDSIKLSAELLPVEYFELINSLWRSLGEVFDKYHGFYGKHVGDGMVYYFVDKPGSNYIMDAIRCSMELREKMKEFSSKWKLRKGWVNGLYLNTGINEGQEFFGTVRYGTTIEFSAFGDTINYAGRLSDFARQGSIWTTKNVIGKLDREDLRSLRFGIRRQDGDRSFFVRHCFSRVIDLVETGHPKFNKFSDIATLPITELMGLIDHEHTDQEGADQAG